MSSMYRFVKEPSSSTSKRLFVQGGTEESPSKSIKLGGTSVDSLNTQRKTIVSSSSTYRSTEKLSTHSASPSPQPTTSGGTKTIYIQQAESPKYHRKTVTNIVTEKSSRSPVRQQQSGAPITTVISIKQDDTGSHRHHYQDGSQYRRSSLEHITSFPGSSVENLQAVHTKRHLSTEVLGSSLESTKTSRSGENGARRITTKIIRKVTTLTRGEEKSVTEDLMKQAETRSVTGPILQTSSTHVTKEIHPKRVKISDIVVGQEPNVSARDALLRWARRSTAKYPGVRVSDFTTSWRDGLAFNALIHRNRPDLVDWRGIRTRHVRERLEYAFHVVEKEYGVTKLLDPEDVDTPEPDEKSLITYISSLHEVFPEPPPIHPLYDMESQRRVQEYREIASQLHLWIREKHSQMQDRTFASTLIEMKKLAAESTRFRNEEVPQRQQEKKRLSHIFRELERYFEQIGEVDLETELHIDQIEKNWNRLMMAHQERDNAILDQLKRLEGLQRLAEKIHREMKQTDGRLDDLEHRIEEESRRLDRMHPLDAKHVADVLDQELRSTEHAIQTLFRDVQTLREGRYPQANDLHKRVTHLHQTWVSLRSMFHEKLLQPLSSLSFPVEERTVTRHTRTVLETRLVDTNAHFRNLQECTDWCRDKLKQLQEADYGNDLQTTQQELEHHQREHKQIDQFHTKIDACIKSKQHFHGEELSLYSQHLGQLQKIYAELSSVSNNRLSDLESLLDFLKSATAELMWLNQKEEIEVTRDWSDKQLNVPALEQYYESLMNELEKREIQFSAVQDRGEALVLQHHPATKCIEAHMSAMQAQWAWLLQLTLCLETHLKHAAKYQQFFKDIKLAEQWIHERDEVMNTEYSVCDFTLDHGERLLQGMQALRDELNEFSDRVQHLSEFSTTIVPLKQRRQPVTRPLPVDAACSYKQANIVIEKGEQCTLHDNSGRVKWRITNSSGVEAQVPGVCFVIPPPDKEALDAAERLRRQFDRSISLWQKKQLRMRQNMIFATIKVVKSWDLAQFVAMGAEQRNAIRRALNEDADKLLAEGDPADPQLRRLRREMEEVNKLFDDFEKRARAEEESKNASRIFNEQATSLQSALEEAERVLVSRTEASLPRDLDTLDHLVIEHKEFENRLQSLSSDIEQVQETFRSIALKTPQMKKSLERVLDKWNNLWELSNLYIERLKCVEIVLNGMDEANNVISDFEHKLASYKEMPSDKDSLKIIHEDLLILQNAVGPQQVNMDQLNDDCDNVRRLTEKSRSIGGHIHRGPHPDIERVEQEVNRLNTRWSNVCGQLVDRLRSCEQAYNLLKNYNKSYEIEDTWLEETYVKLNNLSPIGERAKEQLEPTRSLLTNVHERAPKIEQVNGTGGRFIREGKQAVEEKYRLCDDTLNKLLAWVSQIEEKLASQDIVKEYEEELRNQINTMKQFKEDLDSHNRPIAQCSDQIRQLVLTAGDILSKDEISTLEKNGRSLKQRYDRASDRTEGLLRRLTAARDELSKFRNDLTVFSDWLARARRILEEKERSLADLGKLSSSADSTREFVSDVIAHKADLRFITMAAQKFLNESKEYLTVLNDFRTSLPERLSHVKPLSSQESPVSNDLSVVTQQYRDLVNRTNALSDRISGVGSKQRDYSDAVDKAKRWIREIEPKVLKVLSEPIGAEPKIIEEQLNKAKSLNNEFVAQSRLIDNAKQAVFALLQTLEGQLSQVEISQLEQPVMELEDKYKQLSDALSEKCRELDTALVQSQGVQDALDSLVNWLNQTENQFKTLYRPASLNKERLEEQLREQRLLQSDIDSHRPSIDSITTTAQELISNASNIRVAKKIESKLTDVKSRFDKLLDRSIKRGEFLEEVYGQLNVFSSQIIHLEQWYVTIMDIIESRDLAKLSVDEYTIKMQELSNRRDDKRNDFEDTIHKGKNLVGKKDVTDTVPVRDKIKSLETQWKDLNSLIDEKQKLSKQRSEQLSAYEKLHEQVLEWLTSTENKVSRLESIALDLDTIKRQAEELKPLSKEYRDYGTTIDKINDLGNIYDALVRGERPDSPNRRRSQAYSPTKRTSVTASPLRRLSQDGRSPSPTKSYQLTSPVSPGGSSGFSSRRSSQDGFHLEELSPIQQQLSDINNRYGLLGVRITDRQNELDVIREELRKHLDSLKTLLMFLEKLQRQMPKEFVPNTKEEADKTNKIYKSILEEMYEKQSLLDSTKTQIRDLLRRKPSAIGADRLNDELENVISLWKSLNDKCKDRIRFMENIKDFHDTHDGLNAWLIAKERMLTVLGPISSDSRMVQSQVQQVQVLREEFRGQQPQLQHLNDVGDGVLSSLIPNTPDHQKVGQKLQSVQQKWTDLLARLEERADSLGAAADTSREFDAGLTRLRDALQAISDNLDEVSLDKDPEEQLRKIENLERQLEGQRPLLADAEATGAQLCDVLSDPASRAEIQAKLAAVGRQYNTLQKKLDLRKAEIEGFLRDGRQFEASCAKTLGWLSDELGSLTDRLLISADRNILQQQVDHHEPIYRDVMAREHEVIMLLNKGRDVLTRSKTPSAGDSTRSLQRDVDKIQQQWDKLKKETVDRHTRLQTCLEHCRKYYKAQELFLPWLRQAEDRLDSLQPSSFKRKHMEQQLKDLNQFRNDVWKKSGEYENNRMLGDNFLSACDVDKDVVKSELSNLKQRWDKLNNNLIQKTQSLEEISKRLSDFNEHVRDLQHNVQRCEDRLSSHDALGGAAKDPKLLERIKQLREEVHSLKKPLQIVRQSAQELTNEAGGQGIDASHLIDEVDVLGDRIEDLQSKLDDRCSELQSAATAVTQFNEKVKNLSHDLSGLENEFDSMRPPARDIKTLQIQIDDVAQYLHKVSQTADDVMDAVQDGEVLVDSGFAPDTAQTRQQVETLRRQLQKLNDRGQQREADLQATLNKVQAFYEAHAGVLDDIHDASDQFRKMKPVASEVEQIRVQQDDFRIFRTHTVEPLSQNVDECNKLGQSLIQTAAAGVNTTGIEKDLEKMNEKWNDLKEKMNERERRLDVALLQSGKFQEALDGLSQWLSDTEEMVANQKPPSADYKVVKAQLQEQKFLKKMLFDRQNSMSSLFTMGNEIVQGADPHERKVIEKQLKELMGRFDKLTSGAQQRTLDLEQAMHVAKKFHDKLIPLQEWLDKTEKVIKDMELVPTDEEKIQQRIREHEIVHDDILCKKPDFSDLTEIASNLMELVGEDEALGLADKLQVATDRYTALVEASDNVGQLLTASRQGLRHLVLTYQDLVGWMDAMESRLGRYRVLAVHTDRLLEQMDDLADLTEEISTRQTSVDSTVDSGLELMKHISSDEALQLKDKLDSLQRRFNDLTSRGVDLLKHAQEALPLVEQFHNSHNRLVDWLLPAEGILQHGDPREDDIARLELDIQELRPVLDNINLIGPKLCQISPGEGAATIEGLVTRDNRRFDAIVEQVQRKAERINLSKQRSLEVMSDIDELLEWFREVDSQLRDCDPPSAEPDLIRLQLKEHRALNDDISSQKGRVRDVLSTAKKVLRETSPTEDTSIIREKMEDLREMMDLVSGLSSDRLGILEQALPLAEHFRETHLGLSAWLDDMEQQITMLTMPALRPDLIVQQQDRNDMFLQSINEHKPLVEKLNKTGEALVKLCNEEDGLKVQELLDQDNERYNALKVELRERQQALENALQESSQFTDKLEGMLRALSNTADQVKLAEPISAHIPKIEDQINENEALVGDLNKREEAYAAVKKAANDVLSKAGNRQGDPAIKDIKRKLEKLNNLWQDVQKATNNRGKTLEDALEAAKKFWKELHAVMAVLKDLQDSLNSQEPPAVEPSKIQEQQVALQEIRHEMNQTKPEVDNVRNSGHKLMKLCGEPDKPEVKKHIEDLDHAWDNITALYAKREENLIDAMEKAMEFHETLQNLTEFLSKAEERFSNLGPLGADIDAVKKQIDQLKDFKTDVDPHMVKVEALNRQAQELTERTSVDQAAAIKEPLSAVNRRWDSLLRAMVERQRQLENALLRLGQFQHALNELLVWIDKTDNTLDDLKPILGDPQVLEIELAKLKVLINDIQAHQTSVDTLNDAGRQIVESGKGSDEASTTQDKLTTLNRKWRDLLQKASDRQRELEAALKEAHIFHAEIQDLLSWLADIDGVIAASKPVGGLPETASEQLERFMEVYNELEQNRPKVETALQQGQEYLKKSQASSAMNLAQNLKTLKQRWESTTARANDKKIKLEIALKEATEFHDALQSFVDWLTNAEKILSNLKPVSRVMETILVQIEEHKTFQKDVGVHRETMLNLDKKGTHLKYFSQKQDVILIKNLLISVQHRWERVVAKSAERTRALDHGYKEAREFHDSWSSLMNWLIETETTIDELNAETSVNDPEKIKLRINKHREFQRALSGKQASYDATMKLGKQLKEKAPKTDESLLKQQLIDLKNKWTTVCTKSVERQRKLEEALLYSGQFKDAIQALLDWLHAVEKQLSEDGPVHGDLDTVMALVEQHKNFEQDLQNRAMQMESVTRTGRELEAKANTTDATAIRSQLTQLNSLWDRVAKLSTRKTEKLESALKEAEKLHKAVHMLLEWLSDAEMRLRFAGPLPDDEQESKNQLSEHEQFLRELAEKEHEKNSTVELAQQILAKAHPDAVSVIKHWITIIQSRWEEVSTWAKQRQQRLTQHMQGLKDLDDTLEELLAWLQGLENTLTTLEVEPLPDEIPPLEILINDHQEFMENTSTRQPEVDRVCKARQIKPQTKESPTSRKLSKPKAGIKGSQHDLQRETSPDLYGSLDRKQSLKGSRDHLAANRKGSRASPNREFGAHDGLPHYGPRFPSKDNEPQFRSPRVKLLWDKWRHVWFMAWERQKRLHDKLMYLQELDKVRNFSWDDWRKRFLKFMNHKKSRLTDLFRKMDKDNNGLIPREDFIDGIIKTKFDTSRLEMNAVADLFDRNNCGLIDWKEFIARLRPDWEDRRPPTEADKIHDEVKRLVMLCTCRQKFRVFQVGEGKYRFGDSQKLRLVRILRSTVMVRVGGGWVALDEFLLKNDPCRAKGRTNIELREQFILADGVSQSMTAFKPKTSSSAQRNTSFSGSSGPITKVRERSSRSVPMGSTLATRTSRSSLSAGTPDSLSDNESTTPSYARPLNRKSSAPVRSTPGGSRPSSRPSSRPASRTGSKPPSRHGSNLSLDSTDDASPSKIPISRRTPTSTTRSSAGVSGAPTGATRKLTVPNGTPTRPRTPTGTQSSSTPTTRARTPSTGTPTSSSKLQRRGSGASDIAQGQSRRGVPTPIDQRAPFRS